MIQALVTVISLLVVIVVSLESVFHYREQWKNYRGPRSSTLGTRNSFHTRVGAYSGLQDDVAFRTLVQRVEEAKAAEIYFGEDVKLVCLVRGGDQESTPISSNALPYH